MTDLIERQAAIDEIEERKNANGYRNAAVISELNRLEGYIMRLPSAQPECTNGEWIVWYECPNCGEGRSYAFDTCPMCGRRLKK